MRISRATVLKIGICILLFIEAMQPAIDPDLGWHLRYGQYFFAYGHVLRDNIVSFVWPWYHWVQASWGYDLFVFQIFQHAGFPGLAAVSGFLTLLTFCIVTWPQKRLSPLRLLLTALVFMAITTPMWASGMRTPTLSTPFMAIVIVLADTVLHPDGRKAAAWYLWSLPFIFLIWANLHGGFALGLILLSIFWVSSGIVSRIRKIPTPSFWPFGVALAASWATPLINPWGMRIYEETFKHTTNVNLTIISEWLPLTLMPVESAVAGLMVIFTCVLLIRKNGVVRSIPKLALLALTTYLAYSANRFVVVLGVLVVTFLARELPRVRVPWLSRPWIGAFLWITLIAIVPLDMFYFRRYFQPPTAKIFTFTWSDYCDATVYCSEPITALMRAAPPQGNGFHPYNYGGYLIWRVPEVKTFIDGRMAAWENNGGAPPVSQGDWVFMQNGPVAFRKFDTDYHFTWAIVPTQSGITDYLDDLVKNNQWKRLFQDRNYSYFVKGYTP